MKKQYVTAVNMLKNVGCPVYVHADDKGNFSIDCEVEAADEWASYYSPMGYAWIAERLDSYLQGRGLFAEWVNPGRISVYTA